jgi:cephalosporin hydroxylase
MMRELIDVSASLATFYTGAYEQRVHGIACWKLADDLDRYAKVIADTAPDVVVETGTKFGGSALWFAQQGVDVVTVDVDDVSSREARELTERVWWVDGYALDADVVATVAELVAGRRVMVSLDSDHHAPHVEREIQLYGPLVSPGCYLVVEDGIFDLADPETARRGGVNIPRLGGPLRAVQEVLANDPRWSRDETVEQLSPLSHHPAGWWRRVG